ncbi:MAG TPA: hypothetical protein VGC13_07130 [Longimicrobium sp.]|jgi:outer membrane protein assembly factor BamE (lipoprotein component of BamABCDE complex)|uniref:hypothetical protein n=1 Tax=Longimicrobium sp. TaxID=2029185 RepID=UPI002EDA4AFD
MRTLLHVAVLSLVSAIATPAAAQQPATAPAAQQPASLGATINAFVAIRPGMTVDDVVRVIGRPGRETSRVESAGMSAVSYQWTNDDMSAIIVTFQNNAVISATQMALKPTYQVKPVTLAMHGQLRQGMTVDEVMAALGGGGVPVSFTSMMGTVSLSISWPGEALGSTLLATFTNGRLTTSMQAGLR